MQKPTAFLTQLEFLVNSFERSYPYDWLYFSRCRDTIVKLSDPSFLAERTVVDGFNTCPPR